MLYAEYESGLEALARAGGWRLRVYSYPPQAGLVTWVAELWITDTEALTAFGFARDEAVLGLWRVIREALLVAAAGPERVR